MSALILLLYERVLPGGQLLNQVEDRGYRVEVVSAPSELSTVSQRVKPMLVLADLDGEGVEVKKAIRELGASEETSHIPVIAYGVRDEPGELESVQKAGATLVVTDAAVLAHLDQLMEQALHIE